MLEDDLPFAGLTQTAEQATLASWAAASHSGGVAPGPCCCFSAFNPRQIAEIFHAGRKSGFGTEQLRRNFGRDQELRSL